MTEEEGTHRKKKKKIKKIKLKKQHQPKEEEDGNYLSSDDESLDGDELGPLPGSKKKPIAGGEDETSLVAALKGKIQMLEEELKEKDEIIERLQRMVSRNKELEETDMLIERLSPASPVSPAGAAARVSLHLQNLAQKTKRDTESNFQSFRSITNGLEVEVDGSEDDSNIFVSWKRQTNEIKTQKTKAPQPKMVEQFFLSSRAKTAKADKDNRREASDVLHRLREERANTTTAAPQRKNAQAWQQQKQTFMFPTYKKTEAERNLICGSFENNYIFQNIKASALESFIQAFENVQVHKNQVIMQKGQDVDFFYVIAKGQVSIHAENGQPPMVLEKGRCFGELEILYPSTRTATVIAESEPTKLFRVDQKTFRFTMRRTFKETNRKKMELLKQVKILQDFETSDLQRLCDSMADRKFVKDEIVMEKGREAGNAFYVLLTGSMKVTDIQFGNSYVPDVILNKGDFFGEQAIMGNALPSGTFIGQEDGWCFGIDHQTFQKVLGTFDQVARKSKDKQCLLKVKLIKEAEFEGSFLLDHLAEAIVEQEYEAGDVIQNKKISSEAGLYLIREGHITISTKEYEQQLQAGNYFGEDQLLADAKGLADENGCLIQNYSVICDSTTKVGVLSLKECRLLFDTKTAFHRNKSNEPMPFSVQEFMNVRSGYKQIGTAAAAQDIDTSNKSMGEEDFSQAFYNDRKAIREFFDSFNKPIDELPRERILGEGQFGQVWLIKVDDSKYKDGFALKIQDLGKALNDSEETLMNIQNETRVMGSLQHPFIVDLIASKEDESMSYMLMTLCTGGELWDVIHKKGPDGKWQNGIGEESAKFYTLMIADTVAYIHRQNVLFRDLKPENVMIDSDGYPNIIDFGFAKATTEKAYTFCGTPEYVAPEIILLSGHSVGVDHWAMGIMIYEMICGEHPFYYEGLDNASLFELVTKVEPYPCKGASDEATTLINSLLEKDPTQRLGVLAGKERDILKHKWFGKMNLNELRSKKVKAPWIPGE